MENLKEVENIENSAQIVEHRITKDCINMDEKLTELTTSLSKRQLKLVKKKQKWLERKVEKRLREREKTREKRAFARANNINLGPSRKALKRCTMADSNCKVGISIDMSFDDLMIDKDIAKLTKQILRCYTLNRRAAAPMQLSLTSFNGKSKQDMQKHNGYEHWDVKFHTDSYLDVYPKEKLVYLTSESENIIDHLKLDHVYVIGGLVDHNSHKGHCHKLAITAGVRHARLPLDKFLQMKARKVLTVDHVFEILLKVSEGKTWQEAFLQVLPERKNAQPLSTSKENLESSESSNALVKDGEEMCHLNNQMEMKMENKMELDGIDKTDDVHNESIV